MTQRTLFRTVSVSLLVASLVLILVVTGSESREQSIGISSDQSAPTKALATGESLTADITPVLPLLDMLPPDEQLEQIADWAVYLTLFQSDLDATQIRDALYDKVPFRLSGLDDATNLDYGPGRRRLPP